MFKSNSEQSSYSNVYLKIKQVCLEAFYRCRDDVAVLPTRTRRGDTSLPLSLHPNALTLKSLIAFHKAYTVNVFLIIHSEVKIFRYAASTSASNSIFADVKHPKLNYTIDLNLLEFSLSDDE